MQIKNFEAQNMTEALGMIKKEFGTEAVILSARNLKKENKIFGLRRKRVEVTAAIDTGYPAVDKNVFNNGFKSGMNFYKNNDVTKYGDTTNRDRSRVSRKRISFAEVKKLFMLHQRMVFQGVEKDMAVKLISEINCLSTSDGFFNNENIKTCLAGILERMGLTAAPMDMNCERQKIAAFIGPTGVGKTTTVAKLAAFAQLHAKKKHVALITMDNYRAGAVDQLGIYAKIMRIPIKVASNGKELKEALEKLKDKDMVLVDTTGVNQRNGYHINELKGFFDGIRSLDIHLLLSATTKEKDLVDIIDKNRVVPFNRLIFTKIDESTTHGFILNQLIRTKIPVSYFTNGQQVPDDIEAATLEKLTNLIIDQEETKDLLLWPPEILAEKMSDFEEMLEEAGKKYDFDNLSNNNEIDKYYSFSKSYGKMQTGGYR